jgi:hypothetical protein
LSRYNLDIVNNTLITSGTNKLNNENKASRLQMTGAAIFGERISGLVILQWFLNLKGLCVEKITGRDANKISSEF